MLKSRVHSGLVVGDLACCDGEAESSTSIKPPRGGLSSGPGLLGGMGDQIIWRPP